jgi:hypothetical protein
MKNFVLSQETQGKLGAIGRLLDKINDPNFGFANTSRVSDKLTQHALSSATGLVTLAISHNPLAALGVGALQKALGKDVPAATRLAWLKFMGSKAPIDAGAFAKTVEFMQHTIKGENLLSKATTNIFKAGREVLPASMLPSESDRSSLDKKLKAVQKDPSKLINHTSDISHYLPDHGQAMTQMTTNAVNYLNSIRPATTQNSPLDKPMPPSATATANFNKALDIAQQPLIVLDKAKNGTLTSVDLQHLSAMHPDLGKLIQQRLTDQMATATKDGDQVPYKTRQGLSLLMGQPLDSTMTPNSIMAAQSAAQSAQPQPQQGTPPKPGRNKTNTAKLGKSNSLYKTPLQASETQDTDRS